MLGSTILHWLTTAFRPLGNGRRSREIPFKSSHALSIWLLYILLSVGLIILMHILVLSSEAYSNETGGGSIGVLFTLPYSLREALLLALLAIPISLGAVFFAQVLINRFGYAYMEMRDVLLIGTFCSFPFFLNQLVNAVWFMVMLPGLTGVPLSAYSRGSSYLLPFAVLWFGLTAVFYLMGYKKVKAGQAIFSVISGFIFIGVIGYFLLDKF